LEDRHGYQRLPALRQAGAQLLEEVRARAARSTPCQSCGKRISVSWNALLASSPIILAVVTPALIPMSGTATVLLLAIAFAIAMALHWYTVRLVAK
jgi:hypothetical protein